MKKTKRILGVISLALLTLIMTSCKGSKSFGKPEADMSNIYFEDQYFQYDGENKKMTILGELPDGVEVTYTNNIQKEVGTYEVTATFTTGVYKKIEPRTAKMHIVDINVGSYPQSVVEDATLANNIIRRGHFDKATGRTTFNGKEYKVMKCYNNSAQKSNLKLKNGSIMKYEEVYVFNIEPIKWKILGKNENGYILLAEDILDSSSFFYENFAEYCWYGYEYTADKYDDFYTYTQYGDGSRTYYIKEFDFEDYKWEQMKSQVKSMIDKKSRTGNDLAGLDSSGEPDLISVSKNNYEYSYIRKWLNDEFYNTAFSSDDKTKIVKAKVDNSKYSVFEYYPETFYDKDGNWKYWSWDNDGRSVINFWDRNDYMWNGGMSNDTYDYVYLPSVHDLTNTHYGFSGITKVKDDPSSKSIVEATSVYVEDSARACDISDYAACRGAKSYGLWGWYWDYMTRTPEHDSGKHIWVVNAGYGGQLTTTEYVEADRNFGPGVRPMITVKID